MSEKIPNRLQALVEQATKEFFLANGLAEVNLLQVDPPPYQWSGVIGLAGQLITGSLVVACQEGILNATHPNHSMGMPVTPDDLVDWLGEVSNQILGRVKNLVLDYGVGFSLASPRVIKGDSLSIPPQSKMSFCKLHFNASNNPFTIFFSAEIDPSIDFDKAIKPGSTATEGDALLF